MQSGCLSLAVFPHKGFLALSGILNQRFVALALLKKKGGQRLDNFRNEKQLPGETFTIRDMVLE